LRATSNAFVDLTEAQSSRLKALSAWLTVKISNYMHRRRQENGRSNPFLTSPRKRISTAAMIVSAFFNFHFRLVRIGSVL
jgi:hypothetical protein